MTLSKEEEHKLNSFIEIIRNAKKYDNFPGLSAYDIEWLANKLKETNDKLKEHNA